MKNYLIAISMLAVSGIFYACSKSDDAGTTLKVKMTDNPFNAQEINVDLREVRVNYRGDSTDWSTLTTNARVYNLLGLQNGVDTLIASGNVPGGNLGEIRLILGSNNTIKINNVVYPLTIPSGSESGLKIKVNRKLNANLDSLLIDFDAALSIHQAGNGDYMLKPVLKIK
jgi:hypothetical protein